MPSYANSGSFVKGNKAGRASVGFLITRDRLGDSSVTYSYMVAKDAFGDAALSGSGGGFLGALSHSICFRGVWGYMQGLTWANDATSYNSDNLAGRHMQVGMSRNTISGSLGDSCLVMDTIGFWRFRWAIKTGQPHAVTVLAQQNSTGSQYRPSMVVKANPTIGINNDLSASAPYGPGYQTIGPIVVNPTATGYVWVELHNNNTVYPTVGFINSSSINDAKYETSNPVVFDHLVTS